MNEKKVKEEAGTYKSRVKCLEWPTRPTKKPESVSEACLGLAFKAILGPNLLFMACNQM